MSGSSAAMWRYVKRISPSRSRGTPPATGSLTLSSRSASPQTSSTRRCARRRARSRRPRTRCRPPRRVSTTTLVPAFDSSSAPAGVSATRYSSDLISFATPILISSRATLACARSGTASARRARARFSALGSTTAGWPAAGPGALSREVVTSREALDELAGRLRAEPRRLAGARSPGRAPGPSSPGSRRRSARPTSAHLITPAARSRHRSRGAGATASRPSAACAHSRSLSTRAAS